MNNSMNKSTVFVVYTVGYKAEIFLYIALTIKCAANFLLVLVREVFIQLTVTIAAHLYKDFKQTFNIICNCIVSYFIIC